MTKRKLPNLDAPLRALLLAKPGAEKARWDPPASAMARWDKQVSLDAVKGAWRDRYLGPALKAQEAVVEVLDVIGNFGEFGGVSAEKVSKALKDAGRKPVTVLVNSPGGDMFEGIAIYNILRAHETQVTVRVIGEAASAASVIAMAGDRVEMDESAFMMIHNAWGMAVGDANEMRFFSELLARYDANIAEVYAARTGRSVSEMAAMMKAETWMDGKEAVEKNFADVLLLNESTSAGKNAPKVSAAPARAASGALRQGVAYAMGTTKPGASGSAVHLKGTTVKTTKEQISAFEAKRQASAARMAEIMNKAAEEGRGLDEAETQEYEGLKSEVKGCDEHIVRLKEHEIVMAASAVAVAGDEPAAAAATRGGSAVLSVRSNAPKGTAFTRYAIALARAKGNKFEAAKFAEARWGKEMPEVHKALMTAVDPGTTTDATWAGPLVVVDNLASEFIDLLMPETIIGRITGFRRVPFNVKMPRQTAGSTVGWVGQGKAKPVSELAFDTVTLGFAKISGIIVLTEELVRFSSPSAEALVRSDMIATIAKFMDEQFIDPTVALSLNVSPASVLNGVTDVPSTGPSVAQVDADVKAVMSNFVTANIPLNRGVWVMNPRTALSLSMLRTTQDIKAYPDITPQGGSFWGLPVVTSNNVPVAGTSGDPTIIALIAPQEILLADDGGVSIDVSREASLQLDSAPSSGAQELVSLWQHNLVGLRAERFCNWLKRRAAAAQYISAVEY